MIYDLIVVGAGPAGSTLAREAAAAGASVLLLDRAEFPRDKPCGGGVNIRAAKLLPFTLEPVIEQTINSVAVSLDLGPSFVRHYPRPLCYMTQRSRLDAYLVERAVDAGAQLQEGSLVRSVELAKHGATVRTRSTSYEARAVAGADGANGVVARATGLAAGRDLAVALEANATLSGRSSERWRETLALDLGLVPGGYGWLFPKADHVNIGVGAWHHFGPRLRPKLDRIARYFGVEPGSLWGLRGHHLPIRLPNAPLAKGNVLLVGDAAGLIDPLSGEGIYAAIFSGRLAAGHILSFLSGEANDLSSYSRAVKATLEPDLVASRAFQDVFHLMPAVYLRLLKRNDLVWNALCRFVRGEQTYVGLRQRIGPGAMIVDMLSALERRTPLGRLAGLPV